MTKITKTMKTIDEDNDDYVKTMKMTKTDDDDKDYEDDM